ncbi:MAG: ComEC/Rec2 family competence protein [Rothia sp. (in: high G+C Gram-positive bacteria)]|uniref:ComEC/Rec2 family competence protein n=1 Tax=Rothia sp. (in: high G+C Gram-positive bacteria) TaxID=1885016 RepID=UPI0026DECEB2|nr:ComEC/Rec2 family competence protein [Rothia sp. (in: high G+C Gram-positive bacteria)]MDO5750595.1 ComEC/Rec2 family competence protein [Rothia sp. (in: high G+C Gram-positive bacteria)]
MVLRRALAVKNALLEWTARVYEYRAPEHRRTVLGLFSWDIRLVLPVLCLWGFTIAVLQIPVVDIFRPLTLWLSTALLLCAAGLYWVTCGTHNARKLRTTNIIEREYAVHSGYMPASRTPMHRYDFQSLPARMLAQAIVILSLIALLCLVQGLSMVARGVDDSRLALRQLEGVSARMGGTVEEIRAVDSRTEQLFIHLDSVQYRDKKAPLNEQISLFRRSEQGASTTPQGAGQNTAQKLAGGSRRATASSVSVVTGMRIIALGIVQSRGGSFSLSSATIYPAPGQANTQESAVSRLKNQLRSHAAPLVGSDETALILGTAYGDDSTMLRSTRDSYKLSGLSHLTAVSGANIALVFMLAYRAGLRVRLPRAALIGAGVVGVGLYTVLLGAEGSVIRAVAMGLLGALAMLRGTGRHALAILSTGIMVCLYYQPSLALNIGFGLSVCATASLMIVAPPLTRLLQAALPLTLAQMIAACTCAGLWCAPILTGLSGNIPLYTIPANLLAQPLAALTLCAGLLALLAWATGLGFLSDMFLHLGALPARALEAVATACARAPGNPLVLESSPGSIALVACAVVLVSAAIWVGEWCLFRRMYYAREHREPQRLLPDNDSIEEHPHAPQARKSPV